MSFDQPPVEPDLQPSVKDRNARVEIDFGLPDQPGVIAKHGNLPAPAFFLKNPPENPVQVLEISAGFGS
jgi:hypothetical protein